MIDLPNSCVLVASANVMPYSEETILDAFKKTGCYVHIGSYFSKINNALDELGVSYKDHMTNSIFMQSHFTGKNCDTLSELEPLSNVLPRFKKGRYLVHVKVLSEDGAHTIAVRHGQVFVLNIAELHETYYLGHHEIIGT